jgi:uracil-DNA glycosylase
MDSWQSFIQQQQQQAYYQKIVAFLEQQQQLNKIIYPAKVDWFTAFELTPLNEVKVVILGQDPYHGPDQAHGLSFSVLSQNKIPPSLRNIFKELTTDIEGFITPSHGCLQQWAEQGVLLLNSVLTVEKGKAHSHAKCGWETFTDNAIEYLNATQSGVVYLLWGAHAQKKARLINSDKNLILTSAHPSPLSAHRGFLGCQHFSKTNIYLEKNGKSSIDWTIHDNNMTLF